MTTVKLYWSNICIMHRMEKQLLEQGAQKLAEVGIDLQVRHFGIGYPQRMAEYLAEPNAEIPDIIISTDLEVFEDSRIFSRFRNDLHPLRDLFPIRPEIQGSNICQWRELLPFLVIPMVFCASGEYEVAEAGLSLESVLTQEGIAFGGTGNSAAKAVIKTLWDIFGREAAVKFAQASCISNMPINAFQQVRTGGAQLGIVPTVYAKSANGIALKRYWPKEGAIALPSYVAAGRQIELDVVTAVLDELLSTETCQAYERDGDLYCPLKAGRGNSWVEENGTSFLYPSPGWFENVSPQEFEEIYSQLVK